MNPMNSSEAGLVAAVGISIVAVEDPELRDEPPPWMLLRLLSGGLKNAVRRALRLPSTLTPRKMPLCSSVRVSSGLKLSSGGELDTSGGELDIGGELGTSGGELDTSGGELGNDIL